MLPSFCRFTTWCGVSDGRSVAHLDIGRIRGGSWQPLLAMGVFAVDSRPRMGGTGDDHEGMAGHPSQVVKEVTKR